jgi:hypothetical protein
MADKANTTGTIPNNNISDNTVKPANDKIRRLSLYGFALCVACLVLVSVLFLNFYRNITIPIVLYITPVLFGLANQLVVCGKIQVAQLFSLSILTPVFVSIAYGLSRISFIRYPIEALVPSSSPEFKMKLSFGFYSFWAALYAQIVSGGLLQVCPTKSNMPTVT